MSKKQIKEKKAEKRADQIVKIIFTSLVVLGLILAIWFSLSNN